MSEVQGTIDGQPVTDDDINAMSDRYARGDYTVGKIAKRATPGRPTKGDAPRDKSVVVRFTAAEVRELDELAHKEGTSRSGILRTRLGLSA